MNVRFCSLYKIKITLKLQSGVETLRFLSFMKVALFWTSLYTPTGLLISFMALYRSQMRRHMINRIEFQDRPTAVEKCLIRGTTLKGYYSDSQPPPCSKHTPTKWTNSNTMHYFKG